MLRYFMVLFLSCASAAIIPEELPSLLSVAYSNIPPIKKGTDSRVGFGFSLGNHADFQVVFELGPQANTNPYGMVYPTNTNTNTNTKRQTANMVQKVSQSRVKVPTTDGNKYLTNWLQDVKQKQAPEPFQPLPIPEDHDDSSSIPLGTIDLNQVLANMAAADGTINQPQPSNVPRVVLSQLKQLYGEKMKTKPEPPRFVMKNRVKSTPVPSVERLAQFNVEEDRITQLKKKRVTAELSDVSLDDEA